MTNNIRQNIKNDIIAYIQNRGHIFDNTKNNLFELGLDELDVLELFMFLESKYDLDAVDDSIVFNVDTIEEVIDCIFTEMEEKLDQNETTCNSKKNCSM